MEVLAVEGLPEVAEGADLGALLSQAVELRAGDVVVVSQKAVSKAEGRTADLTAVSPGKRAGELAASLEKDPRLVQLILDESRAVVRAERGVLIVETRGGWICANAGIDASNVPGDERVTLLPVDADASARRIRSEVAAACGVWPGVIVADSFGRPWRVGQADVAIGCAGVDAVEDWRDRSDRDGRPLAATLVAIADELASAADLVRAKDAGIPAAVVRGLGHLVREEDGPGAAALRRARPDDLFR
jgi:coenzyme F420-0:L-glutamate ligase/coenzyme F420-1:gamma-L-glutamate ligase